MEKGPRGRLDGTRSPREMHAKMCACVHGREEGRARALSDSHSHLVRSLKYHWSHGVERAAIRDSLQVTKQGSDK